METIEPQLPDGDSPAIDSAPVDNLQAQPSPALPAEWSMRVRRRLRAAQLIGLAIVLIGAILYVFANLMTDLCYALFDPRVRLD